jgi:hypothetical protein
MPPETGNHVGSRPKDRPITIRRPTLLPIEGVSLPLDHTATPYSDIP